MVHVDGPVGVFLTSTALKLPDRGTKCQVRDAVMRVSNLQVNIFRARKFQEEMSEAPFACNYKSDFVKVGLPRCQSKGTQN